MIEGSEEGSILRSDDGDIEGERIGLKECNKVGEEVGIADEIIDGTSVAGV